MGFPWTCRPCTFVASLSLPENLIWQSPAARSHGLRKTLQVPISTVAASPPSTLAPPDPSAISSPSDQELHAKCNAIVGAAASPTGAVQVGHVSSTPVPLSMACGTGNGPEEGDGPGKAVKDAPFEVVVGS